METGLWIRGDDERDVAAAAGLGSGAADDAGMAGDTPDPKKMRQETVVPFVEDRRNALIFQLETTTDTEGMASLQYALKRGIEAHFQLEDTELAAEPLPDADDRRYILFYEAAEGGAGVLSRLVDEKDALAAVARRALEICHFGPDGEDQGLTPGRPATEPCVQACYDCLLSYSNQREHKDLSRFARGAGAASPPPHVTGGVAPCLAVAWPATQLATPPSPASNASSPARCAAESTQVRQSRTGATCHGRGPRGGLRTWCPGVFEVRTLPGTRCALAMVRACWEHRA
jgi:hypothetical protein